MTGRRRERRVLPPGPVARRRALLALGLASLLAGGLAIWTLREGPSQPIPRAALAARPSGRGPVQALERGNQGRGNINAVGSPQPGSSKIPDPVRRWQARPAGEWQGMLVDLDAVPPCDSSAVCGLARACVQGQCIGCQSDSQCAAGEACVLDHCVVVELVGCRRRSDCARGGTCILSGYSSLPRGNEDMRAFCVDPNGGADKQPGPAPTPSFDNRASLPDDELLRKAREAATGRE